ncbi:MAG: beta-ketoacyl-[acyl-carrier-protein] synthase II [Candidatus Eisenbacteria bacterium RBG_16_71_46]|nr:MAG: beta-ketoacyl-[acyl-carrier-protein] synthase II [Candidatus Eisenbacteria bacterium RBG_16_71_46]OGF22828.1 MAG: beta-ketoacyl-[acyl-carrier-protein] synthase II [Candidatus Eisenbacteria bacterium RBG_19FT_COMBO_70_11]
MSDDERRVLITGTGVVSPIGKSTEEFWKHLIAGKSGAGPITRFDASGYDTRFACEVKDFTTEGLVDRKDAKRMDRFVQFAVVAAHEAIQSSALDLERVDHDRVGVILGSGIGGMETFETQHTVLMERGPARVSPFFVPMMISDMAAGQVSIQFGLRGPNFATVSACASGAHAIGEALRLIRAGDADVILAGGCEATITPMAMAGFGNARTLSTRNDDPQRASRPFDQERDGFVIGEGAGIIVLESEDHARRRDAPLLCELAGYGASADAFHITAPSADGNGAARAMRRALDDARQSPEDVLYINAHGTSTPTGDPIEVQAVKTVFGEHARRLMMSSTKSMTGHLLGAAGGLEAVVTALILARGIVPPTINLERPDPQCDLDFVPNQARPQVVRAALSNSFGFGGHNVTLAVRAVM